MNESLPDTPTEPVANPSPPAPPRTGLIRWLGILIAFGMIGFQIILLIALNQTDWHEGLVFYPLIHAHSFVFHAILAGLSLLAIILAILWFQPKQGAQGDMFIIFIVFILTCAPIFLCGYLPFVSNYWTPADSITVDGHTYRLVIETQGSFLDPNHDYLIVYRCDRYGILCRGIHIEDVDTYDVTEPSLAIEASKSGDLRLVHEPDGSLSIHYDNEVLPIPSPDD